MNGKRRSWRVYKKFIVAGSGATIVTGLAALDQTGVLSDYPWVSAAVAVATAVGVRQVTNQPYTIAHPVKAPVAGYTVPEIPPEKPPTGSPPK